MSYCAPPPTPIWWPIKLPGETINQSFDVSTLPVPISIGQVAGLNAQIAPSGAGELSASSLTFSGTVLTLEETGGVSGRIYTILFTATLHDGEIVQWIINQGVGLIPPPNPIQPPPAPGFGTEIVWMPTSNNVTTNALAASLVLSAAPCSVANIQASATTFGGWVLLFDATSVPADGPVAPIRKWNLQPGQTLPLQSFVPPLTCVNGAVLAFSAAVSPYILTSSPTADLAGEVL